MAQNSPSLMDSFDSSSQIPGSDMQGSQIPDVSSTASATAASLSDTMDSFSQPSEVNTTSTSFLDSNGIVAKIVFLIMVILIFIVLFFITVKLIGYFLQPSPNPMIINGQINGTKQMIITQNPANKSSVLITRSNNQRTGIEFTWSIWINISKTGSAGSTVTPDWHSPVFVKGDISLPNDGINQYCSLNNGPGVYLGKPSDPNHLYILMDTIETPAISSPPLVIDIPNLPTDYFHLAVRCQNTYIDVYINGNLVKRHNLMNVPKQNYYDIAVAPYNGFNGSLSNLQYFSYGLNVIDLNKIVKAGPNMKDITQGAPSSNAVNAVSTQWYNSFL